MKLSKLFRYLVFLVVIFVSTIDTNAQLFSPGRNWAGPTQYANQNNTNDSIFVFYTPGGTLRAQFSDKSKSIYTWYKYDQNERYPSLRFKQIAGATDSVLTSLPKGGYRVSVKRISDDSTQIYTCWLMIDDVVVNGITANNNCDYLYLVASITPDRYTIVYDYFTYWDVSNKSNHPEVNKLGSDYFKYLTWTASNSQVTIPTGASLNLLIEDPAPLYDSKYTLRIQDPFGRNLTKETALITSKAVKADFQIYLDKDDAWTLAGDEPSGEAPLKLKFESKSINCDSIYWRVINDEKLFKRGADSIVWRDSSLFNSRIESYPTPEKMIPGTYPIEHIAVKLSSGCRDTMYLSVLVDSSMIKEDAIPNVFSPNGDNLNDLFKLKDPKTNIQSIRSFHIVILSRWGNLVYEYSGDPKEWEGWNGLIHGNRGEAPEGVYYYIIEAKGWDNKTYKGGVYKGFLHLFRGK